ncbi:hypothetical protein [Fannyhessea vaginae]|uniref:hypothetical protein n=1 Tax=Fannyhessea vaginae TaxID=82135 RepID=UPI00206FCC09|nr:hypothetical protein [Fannyhessea vaginae]DAK30262.1 MAG TPA: hypothetical protein [Caudoviricetes sp.]
MDKHANTHSHLYRMMKRYSATIISAVITFTSSAAGIWFASYLSKMRSIPVDIIEITLFIGVIIGSMLSSTYFSYAKQKEENNPFYKAVTYIQGARPKTCHCFSSIAAHDSSLFSSDLDVEDDLAALSKLGLIEGSNRVKKGYKAYCVTPLGKLVFDDEKETILEKSKVWDEIIDTYKRMDDPSFD